MNKEIMETIHRQTIYLMNKANVMITNPDDKLWYNGQFYSGSLNPEILFVGFNPGYTKPWKNRPQNMDFSKPFELNEIKYIKEKEDGATLAKNINKMFLQNLINQDTTTDFLRNSVAETNLIHFNTPDIKIFNHCFNQLDNDMQSKLMEHFTQSFKDVIKLTNPKLLIINGQDTFDNLTKKIEFEEPKIIDFEHSLSWICKETSTTSVQCDIFIVYHLSRLNSNKDLSELGKFFLQKIQ